MDRSLACPAGHCFDLARAGYANLARSRRTGDSAEMLHARRRFLDAGHYQPLSDLVNRLVGEHYQERPLTVVDAGCGEGYYLGRLLRSFGERICVHALGLDLARDAARLAAARYQDACFLVADLADHIPVLDGLTDVLLTIFAPRHGREFARVLAPGGLLLSAIPAPEHLGELRHILPLIGIEERKAEHLRAALGDSFVPAGSERLSYPLSLAGEAVGDLVAMTPTARHLDDAARARLAWLAGSSLTVTASFLVLSFHRRYT